MGPVFIGPLFSPFCEASLSQWAIYSHLNRSAARLIMRHLCIVKRAGGRMGTNGAPRVTLGTPRSVMITAACLTYYFQMATAWENQGEKQAEVPHPLVLLMPGDFKSAPVAYTRGGSQRFALMSAKFLMSQDYFCVQNTSSVSVSSDYKAEIEHDGSLTIGFYWVYMC